MHIPTNRFTSSSSLRVPCGRSADAVAGLGGRAIAVAREPPVDRARRLLEDSELLAVLRHAVPLEVSERRAELRRQRLEDLPRGLPGERLAERAGELGGERPVRPC